MEGRHKGQQQERGGATHLANVEAQAAALAVVVVEQVVGLGLGDEQNALELDLALRAEVSPGEGVRRVLAQAGGSLLYTPVS